MDPAAETPANGFVELPITAHHALEASSLPRHHDDPFDRMLVAQAQADHLLLVTRDPARAPYGVQTLHALAPSKLDGVASDPLDLNPDGTFRARRAFGNPWRAALGN